MKIAMIGAGYVGLVTGTCLAKFDHTVVCVDYDLCKIEKLKNGVIPIYEPGLDEIVAEGISKNRLSFTTELGIAMKDAEIIMIAVGTPCEEGTEGKADLSFVFKAVEAIAEHLTEYAVIVTKSTVPVGTSQQILQIIQTKRPELREGIDFDVASNPEFLREGSAISDFMHPDRVVIGTETDKAKQILQKLYNPLVNKGIPLVCANRATSELIKYASNGFLAIKIGFINQMADICEKAHADVQLLAQGMGLDKRIGSDFLQTGPGYGGSCFPKDTKALSQTAHALQSPCTIIDAVIEANTHRKEQMAQRIITLLQERKNPHLCKVAILGITFKANTDDMREAASLVMIPALLDAGIAITVFDPLYRKGVGRLEELASLQETAAWYEKVDFADTAEQATADCDAVVLLTGWSDFHTLDLKLMHRLMHPAITHKADSLNIGNTQPQLLPLFIDYQNFFTPVAMKNLFDYVSLGRPRVRF